MDQKKLRHRVAALSKTAYLAGIPTFSTASEPNGPNGPLIPEVHDNNPNAVYIGRTGQINAWDNPAWVDAIKKTGRKTILVAGTLTSVCMAFPSLSAVTDGYKVFAVIDASGNWDSMATELTIARMAQAGVKPIDTFAVHGEIMATWNRPDAMEYAQIIIDHIIPEYKFMVENYQKAQHVQKNNVKVLLITSKKNYNNITSFSN